MDNARKACIFLCILIVIMDVIAGILSLRAQVAQNKVQHLKLWMLECRGASHEAYKLGFIAAEFFGVSHVIVNLLCVLHCTYVKTSTSSFKEFRLACLVVTWILWGVGLGTLVMGTRANKSSKALCDFSDNHLLKIGGICCFIHCILCIAYYATTGSNSVEQET